MSQPPGNSIAICSDDDARAETSMETGQSRWLCDANGVLILHLRHMDVTGRTAAQSTMWRSTARA